MSDEKRKASERFKELQKEIAELRKKLDNLNSEKEKWFRKKEELKKEIAELVKKAKLLRAEKDKINQQVKDFKEKRDKQNSITKEKIEIVKELRGKINSKVERKSPGMIKEEIDKLEERIETEVLSFSNEKKLMKRIGKLKKEYEKAKSESSVFDERDKLDKEIDESKKRAEEFHGKVQELAGKSKEKHEAYLEISKKIKEINNEQEKAFDNFLKFKEEFNGVSKEVDNKLDELKDVKAKIDEFKLRDKEKKEWAKKKVLIKKAEDIEEKLKKGEKLTTEDLIKFQGGDER